MVASISCEPIQSAQKVVEEFWEGTMLVAWSRADRICQLVDVGRAEGTQSHKRMDAI